jgi:hypothetical protein
VKTAVRLLVCAMDYDVPAQDLRIDLSTMPAMPGSRFVIGNVRQASGWHAPLYRSTLSGQAEASPSAGFAGSGISRKP